MVWLMGMILLMKARRNPVRMELSYSPSYTRGD